MIGACEQQNWHVMYLTSSGRIEGDYAVFSIPKPLSHKFPPKWLGPRQELPLQHGGFKQT